MEYLLEERDWKWYDIALMLLIAVVLTGLILLIAFALGNPL